MPLEQVVTLKDITHHEVRDKQRRVFPVVALASQGAILT
jgi:hypothetical protein